MRRIPTWISSLCVVLLLVAGAVWVTADEGGKSGWGWTEENPTLQIVWLKPGAKWVKDTPWNEQPGVQEHAKYLKTLHEKGQIVLGGPLTDNAGGLVILKVKDAAEAKKIAAGDPAVKSGLMSAETHPWLIATTGKPAWAPEPDEGGEKEGGEKSCGGGGKSCGGK